MLTILKMITLFTSLNGLIADIMPQRPPGSQQDEHGCVLDGGYQWCESLQQCQRLWETPCEEIIDKTTDFCPASNVQMCRMACNEPICPSGQCAMRVGNCCDYTCSDTQLSGTNCPNECPPPAPCPMPAIGPNCRYVPPISNNCGCSSECWTVDCSSHNIISEGEACGGFMPYGMAGVCGDGLECTYTMGPMIADAPGTCQTICQTTRDSWGNCIDEGCSTWFDGCNTCIISDNNQVGCSEKMCYEKEEAYCMDDEENSAQIPKNCVTWYDGCNTCSTHNGELQGCTMMMCFTQNEPYCQVFTSGDLYLGDLCYRFCEDGSQNMIDRQNDCPLGTECSSKNPSVISFDSCGNRAHTCNVIDGEGH